MDKISQTRKQFIRERNITELAIIELRQDIDRLDREVIEAGQRFEQLEAQVAAKWTVIAEARAREGTLFRQVADADSILRVKTREHERWQTLWEELPRAMIKRILAPEYALRGYLTDIADVYSFGIVTLEIVSGKSNTSYKPKSEGIYLLDWAYVLQERGSLMELVDPKLGSEFNKEEAIGMITIALFCTNTSSTLRPTMSAVVSMLEGRTDVQNHISVPNLSSKLFEH